MERDKAKDLAKQIVPWTFSIMLLGFVVYTQDLRVVWAALIQADYVVFIMWTFVFVVFWLFWQSLIFYLCLRWLVVARSPYVDYEPEETEIRFGYLDIVRAAAAADVLKIIGLAVSAGGLVVYLSRAFGISYKRATAALLMGLQNIFLSMGIVAYAAINLLPRELIPIHAETQIELAKVVGLSGIGIYLIMFVSALMGRVTPMFKDRDHFFTPFIWCRLYVWPVILVLAVVQMASYGVFVILTMPAFDLNPPMMATMALTQVVTLARTLPFNAQGIGLDQVTFPFLFKGWGPAHALVAFSVCYTVSKILFRFIIGLPFFTRATREMFEKEPEEAQEPDES